MTLPLFNHSFKLLGVDEFTRKFYAERMGIAWNNSQELEKMAPMTKRRILYLT